MSRKKHCFQYEAVNLLTWSYDVNKFSDLKSYF
jgi:hypothetical protein